MAWKNKELAERKLNDKVRWVLQESTADDGTKLLSIRKFVTTSKGEKPSSAGITLKAEDALLEFKIVCELLQELPGPNRHVVVRKNRYFKGIKEERVLFSDDVDDAMRMSKDKADRLVSRHGDESWFVMKLK